MPKKGQGAKAGRPRRFAMRRYPNGQIVHSERKPKRKSEDERSGVRAWRRRMHPDLAPRTLEEEALAGYELGRLLLRGVISQNQFKAGEDWARRVTDFTRAMGYPAPTPPSVALGEMGGKSCAPDPDPRRVEAVRRAYEDAFRALSEAGATLLERRSAMTACREVCLRDADTRDWPHHMIDALKRGLDRLALLSEK